MCTNVEEVMMVGFLVVQKPHVMSLFHPKLSVVISVCNLLSTVQLDLKGKDISLVSRANLRWRTTVEEGDEN